MPAKEKSESNLHEAYKSKRGPKAIIDYFFYKITITESIIIVLLAVIFNILIYWLLKGQDLGNYVLSQIFSGILINWLLLGLLVYLIMYFIRGKNALPKKPFEKVLSTLSAFRLTAIIYVVLCAIIAVVFFPALISLIQATALSPSLINSTTLFPEFTTANVIGFLLLLILTLFMIIYWLIMLYQVTEIVFDIKNVLQKIGLTALLFIVVILINLL